MIGVYKITNPLNEVYIGQSCDIETRFKQHKKYCNNKKLKESFLKYGIEKHKFEIILECEINELTEKEFEIITSYRKEYVLFNASDYESFAGRKPMYNVPSKIKRVLIRIDKEKEMTAEIKAIQEKYKIM